LGGALIALTTVKPGFSQSLNLGTLNQNLQSAVSSRNWDSAVQIIDQMIQLAPEKRQSLEQYRAQLSALQSPKPSQAFTATPSRVGQVPIKRRDSGVVIIDTQFNNRKQFDMLLDSGASVTVITREMADSLGIRPEHVVQTETFSTANGLTEMPIVYIQSISVGGLVARDVPVAIAGAEMKIGLLGQDFLQRYDVTIKRDSVEFNRRQ
jgi:aspartyl protease family protein